MRNYSRKFRRNGGDPDSGMLDSAKEKAKGAFSSFTNMIPGLGSDASAPAPAPASGGRRSRRRQSRKNRNRRSRR